MTAGDLTWMAGGEPIKTRKAATLGEAGYERSAHEAYFTPEWVTRALLQAVDFRLPGRIVHASGEMDRDPAWDIVWEPACGAGHIARPLQESGYLVIATDLADWGYGDAGRDFLRPSESDQVVASAAIVTNPPFDLTVQFAERALELTKARGGKVALLQRHEWDAAIEREPLFQITGGCKYLLPRRPYWIIPPTGLPPSPGAAKMAKIPTGADGKAVSPRFPFAWYVWDWRLSPPWTRQRLPDPDKPQPTERLL